MSFLHFIIIFSFLIFFIIAVFALVKISSFFNFKEFRIVKLSIGYNLTIVSILILIGCLFLIIYFINSSETYIVSIDTLMTKNLGQLGDLFNGIVTPSLTLVSIFLLFKAFEQQFRANNLLNDFEIERTFKSDIEWLREGSLMKMIQNKSKKNEFNDDDFLPANNLWVNRAIYIISTFSNLLERNKIRKLNKIHNHNNVDSIELIESEILNLLKTLYYDIFKELFRKVSNYCKNKNKWELSNNEVLFLNKFIKLYKIIEKRDQFFDNGFSFLIKETEKNINIQNNIK